MKSVATTPSTYTKRSNATRAGLATLGAGKFEVIALDDGKFTYQPIGSPKTNGAASAPVDAEPTAAPVVAAKKDLIDEAYDMGKQRSEQEREGAIADALNMGEQAQDKETARAAVRKLERLRADVPDSLRQKATGEKPAKPAKSRERVKGTTPAASAPRDGSKEEHVISLLRRSKGLSLTEMQAETGWQPHTCRGFIAGAVKVKRGLNATSEKDAKRGRVYRVVTE